MEKKDLTIGVAVELLQNIRYYDKDHSIVILMDESEEMDYVCAICKRYNGTPKQIIEKLRLANLLESLGLINVNNPSRAEKIPGYIKDNNVVPRVKIRRKN